MEGRHMRSKITITEIKDFVERLAKQQRILQTKIGNGEMGRKVNREFKPFVVENLDLTGVRYQRMKSNGEVLLSGTLQPTGDGETYNIVPDKHKEGGRRGNQKGRDRSG